MMIYQREDTQTRIINQRCFPPDSKEKNSCCAVTDFSKLLFEGGPDIPPYPERISQITWPSVWTSLEICIPQIPGLAGILEDT